jgi:hypothetical protein
LELEVEDSESESEELGSGSEVSDGSTSELESSLEEDFEEDSEELERVLLRDLEDFFREDLRETCEEPRPAAISNAANVPMRELSVIFECPASDLDEALDGGSIGFNPR